MKFSHFHVLADGNAGGGLFSALQMMHSVRGISRPTLVTQVGSYAAKRCQADGFDCVEVDLSKNRLSPKVATEIDCLVSTREPAFIFAHGGISLHFCQRAALKHGAVGLAYAPHGYRFPSRNAAVRLLKPLVERRLSKRVDAIIYVAEYEGQIAKKYRLLPATILQEVVYNPIEKRDIPTASSTDLRLIGFLGRLVKQKNPMFVVQVARLLRNQGYRFRMVGGGPLESEVRLAIKRLHLEDTVEITGEQTRESALELMRSAGAAILPSYWEGLPRVAPELMIMGVPLVASNVSGTPEIVRDGVTGAAISGFRPEKYAESLVKMTTDVEYRNRIIKDARKLAEEIFSPEAAKIKYERIANRLIRMHIDRSCLVCRKCGVP